jgi:pimeloyl-ACP methyl ester carboxylesterase
VTFEPAERWFHTAAGWNELCGGRQRGTTGRVDPWRDVEMATDGGDHHRTCRERTHMYACDLRGHGRSDWADSGYRVSDYVEDISAFVGAASKVGSVLIGYSLGGLIAFGVAPRLPDLVAGCYRDRSPACAAGFGFRGHRVFRCARLDPLGQ